MRRELAAEIALLIGERGLGGDDVDLRARLDALHRDRTPRSRDARAMAKRWSDIACGPTPNRSLQAGREQLSIGSLLALAYPERIAKNRGGSTGAFLLVNGRGANVDRASALAREPFLAVAEMTGTAALSRILLATPITLEEIEARFANQIEARDDVTFDAASASLRGRRSRRLGAIALSEQPIRVTAERRKRAKTRRRYRETWHRAAALDQGPETMARPRDVPARERRPSRIHGPTCPTWR